MDKTDTEINASYTIHTMNKRKTSHRLGEGICNRFN